MENPKPSRPAPAVSLIGERYEVVGNLGEGPLSKVYRALDHEAGGRTVTLKILRADALDYDALDQHLAAHREALMALDHPGLERLLDVGRTPLGLLYIASDFTAGENLAQLRERRGALVSERVGTIGLQLLDALAAAHGAGVPHGNLHPGNVVLAHRAPASPGDPFGTRVVLTDHGLLQLVGAVRPGERLAQRAPELLSGSPPTVAGDLFAAAALLAELETGVPLEGTPSADTPLGPVWSRSLAPDPDERHPDASAFRSDLERRLADLAPKPSPDPVLIAAHDPTRGERDQLRAEVDRARAERDRIREEADRARAAHEQTDGEVRAELERAQLEAQEARAERDRFREEADRARAAHEQTDGEVRAKLERAQLEAQEARAERDRLREESDRAQAAHEQTDGEVRAELERAQLEAQEARAERDRLREESDRAQAAHEQTDGEVRAELERAQLEAQEALAERDRIREEADRARAAHEEADVEVRSALERAQGNVHEFRAELERIQGEADQARARYEQTDGAARADLESAQRDAEEARAERDRARSEAEEAGVERDRARGEADAARSALDRAVAEAEEARVARENALAAGGRELAAANEEAAAERRALQIELDRAKQVRHGGPLAHRRGWFLTATMAALAATLFVLLLRERDRRNDEVNAARLELGQTRNALEGTHRDLAHAQHALEEARETGRSGDEQRARLEGELADWKEAEARWRGTAGELETERDDWIDKHATLERRLNQRESELEAVQERLERTAADLERTTDPQLRTLDAVDGVLALLNPAGGQSGWDAHGARARCELLLEAPESPPELAALAALTRAAASLEDSAAAEDLSQAVERLEEAAGALAQAASALPSLIAADWLRREGEARADALDAALVAVEARGDRTREDLAQRLESRWLALLDEDPDVAPAGVLEIADWFGDGRLDQFLAWYALHLRAETERGGLLDVPALLGVRHLAAWGEALGDRPLLHRSLAAREVLLFDFARGWFGQPAEAPAPGGPIWFQGPEGEVPTGGWRADLALRAALARGAAWPGSVGAQALYRTRASVAGGVSTTWQRDEVLAVEGGPADETQSWTLRRTFYGSGGEFLSEREVTLTREGKRFGDGRPTGPLLDLTSDRMRPEAFLFQPGDPPPTALVARQDLERFLGTRGESVPALVQEGGGLSSWYSPIWGHLAVEAPGQFRRELVYADPGP